MRNRLPASQGEGPFLQLQQKVACHTLCKLTRRLAVPALPEGCRGKAELPTAENYQSC